MNRLQLEWQRLYLPQPSAGDDHDATALVAPDGRVRALVLELARPADWTVMAQLWQGVQTDLQLPAPAIAVSGVDGYQLWFSVAEPLPVAQASDFLEALRVRYLADIARPRVTLMPMADADSPQGVRHARAVPAVQAQGDDRWSAFVARDLAPVFADTPWLDVEPSQEGQADLLARLDSITPTNFQQAMGMLTPAVGSVIGSVAPVGASQDPRQFLLDVMNNSGLDWALRIEAAKALLPHVNTRPPPG